jgi:molybdenum cofactor sulfurtransferase
LPAKSLIDAFAKDLGSHIYGNPHTNSLPARNSSARVNIVRKRALEFFHANPNDFDLVFVANATAAIKLVSESVRDYVDRCNEEDPESTPRRLWYGYHKDAHNSLVGPREITNDNSRCFRSDAEVEHWIEGLSDRGSESQSHETIGLFAYPGQSNMTGRRLPLRWSKDIKAKSSNVSTLLDAAALATTRQLELDEWQPDFTAISFYKIFGFPDLGALIVRKAAAHILRKKRYFAGGTVDGVLVMDKPSVIRRGPIHEQLEEGTLPFRSIIALDHALTVHERLFKSMDRISKHVTGLTAYCASHLQALVYPTTGQSLCELYTEGSNFGDPATHGGTIAFNLYRCDGSKIGYRSVEQAADKANIYVRSGAMCNPGGMATHLGWTTEQLEECFAAGFRCSKPIEVFDGKWTGVVRVSFGANSVKGDVDMLVRFLREWYLHGMDGRPVSDTES